ncbi:MAG: GAF domain-containing sensor histidine kinase [Chloroflexota bacterium]
MSSQSQLEQQTRQLAALHEAAIAIASEFKLDKVLQRIVDAARDLVSVEYAALGVTDGSGFFQTFIHSGMDAEAIAKIPHIMPKGLGILGAVVHSQRVVRLPDIEQDERAIGLPAGHPPMHSFLGVPIVAGGQVLGNLYLTNKQEGDAFSEADQRLVEMLAAHAAVAIQNAQLYEEVSRLAVLDERTRIGMDLHDGVIQSIYAVGLTLEAARYSLDDKPEDSKKLLAVAAEGLDDAIRDIRNFILDLRPRHLSGSLRKGLARLVREFQANTMVAVTMSKLPPLEQLPTAVSQAIFFTTQGALANVARHARATQVEIELVEEGETAVLLTIRDNGSGFDVQQAEQAIGHGLSNMKARAAELGGTLSVQSAQGEGTTIQLELPRSLNRIHIEEGKNG